MHKKKLYIYTEYLFFIIFIPNIVTYELSIVNQIIKNQKQNFKKYLSAQYDIVIKYKNYI